MKQVLARAAALLRHALVRRHYRVANGALALSLQRADDISAEGEEAVDDGAILDSC